MENNKPLLTIGVVSDTHIPDRASFVLDELNRRLKEINVDLILHAGDISVPSVLDELGKIAPVRAVRGNRDFLFQKRLPLELCMDLAGIPVVLTHGHGGWVNYLQDKLEYIFHGYVFDRYQQMLIKKYSQKRVIIFGHTHFAENRWVNGILFFNPGSCTLPTNQKNPSFGVLKIFEDGNVLGELHRLKGKGKS